MMFASDDVKKNGSATADAAIFALNIYFSQG
jgi:hypothetical protein